MKSNDLKQVSLRNSTGKRLTEILEYQEGDLDSEQDLENDEDYNEHQQINQEREAEPEEEDEDDQSAEGDEEAAVYTQARSQAIKSRSMKIPRGDPVSSVGSVDVN